MTTCKPLYNLPGISLAQASIAAVETTGGGWQSCWPPRARFHRCSARLFYILRGRQLLDLDLLKLHYRAGVMALQREVSFLVTVFRVPPIDRCLAVDFDDDVIAFGNHFLR